MAAGTIHVILNRSSGLRAKESVPDILTRVFREHGSETRLHHPAKGVDISELTRGLISEGATIIAAGGGDGTLNAVASALAGTSTLMGVLPVGTLNHFARDLRIPLEIEGAARVIAKGHHIAVDLGEVNGRRFINNAIIGLYPAYRFQRERHQRRGRSKWLAMASALVNVIRTNPAMHVRLKKPGLGADRRTPFLMVANNCHRMEGYDLGTRERMDEGLLWLYVMHRMTRVRLMKLGMSILLGRFSKAHDFDIVSASEFVVESRRKSVGVSLDGEVVRMNYPLCYKSLPKALRVIVPASTEGKRGPQSVQ